MARLLSLKKFNFTKNRKPGQPEMRLRPDDPIQIRRNDMSKAKFLAHGLRDEVRATNVPGFQDMRSGQFVK
jgi:hypothetical protein